jgi:hypothetical protein
MLKAPGDLGFGDKPLATARIRRARLLHLLERDPTVQLRILRGKDLTQATRRMQPERLKTHLGARPVILFASKFCILGIR